MALITGIPDFFNTSKVTNFDLNSIARKISDQVGGQAAGLENRCLFSEGFTNAVWAKTGVGATADTTASPDYINVDAVTADTITAAAGAGNHFTSQPITIGAAETWTFSLSIKKSNYRFFSFGSGASGERLNIDLDASPKIVSLTGPTTNIIAYGEENIRNGFTRFFITFVNNNGSNGLIHAFTDASFNISFTAAGTEAVFAWGAQATKSRDPGVYTSTVGAAVAENLYIQNTGNLDGTNIVSAAGFRNQQKAEAKSFFDIPVHLVAPSAATGYQALSVIPPLGIEYFIYGIGILEISKTNFFANGTLSFWLNNSNVFSWNIGNIPGSLTQSAGTPILIPINVPIKVSVNDYILIDPSQLVINATPASNVEFAIHILCTALHYK